MINLQKCYFHAIVPFFESHTEKKISDIWMRIHEGNKARLKKMLELGSLIPGKELSAILGVPQSMNPYIYLAQSYCTLLPSVGNSYTNGEFSAYSEHILGHPSFVFDEYVIDGLKIPEVDHWLSEEVCVEGRIPISRAIALALPYQTPYTIVREFLRLIQERTQDFPFEDLLHEYQQQVEFILNDIPESVKKYYKIIDEYTSILENYNIHIPCINYSGEVYCENYELQYIKSKQKELRSLVKEL